MKEKLSIRPGGIPLAKRSFLHLHCLMLFISLFAYNSVWSQCTAAPAIAGASNITNTTARINWNAVAGVTSPTYTLEVYTDAAFTVPFGTYTALTSTNHLLTSLIQSTPYYFRVKVDNTTCGDYGTGSVIPRLSYTPVDVTGFTADVIANGTGPALNSTTNSVDSSGANNAYMSIDYKLTATTTALTYGLPVSRSLTSPSTSDLKYILQDYSLNNSVRLNAQNDFGLLTLVQPQKFTNIYLAVASGDGESTFDVEVQFADATTQTITGSIATNWDSNPIAANPVIVTGIGRVARTSGSPSTGQFKLFQTTLNIDVANYDKLVNAIKITKTNVGTDTKIPNIFAVSGRVASTCPTLNPATTTTTSYTSATLNWTLAFPGINGNAANVTYTVEVYANANYTSPVTGSPFTGLTTTSQLVSGLTLDTPYYYRIKANNGTCDSEYVTGTISPVYCVSTVTTANSNTITNITTTGGFVNINNTTTVHPAYNNFSTQSVARDAGTSFTLSGTKSGTTTRVMVYVDWNKDLDFDDTGETLYNSGASTSTAFSASIAVPAGTPLGNYRMRVRTSSATAITPCAILTNGETEDYTLTVVTQPADCTTPGVAGIQLSGVTASGITATITAPTTVPTGYLLVRSTVNTLSAAPVSGTYYTAGSDFGGGVVVASGTTLTTFTDFVGANTRYFYFLYTYNAGGLSCFGPIYSAAANAEAITCAKPVTAVAASNITANTARLNWSSIVGSGGTAANYTVELYSDAALTALVGSYTTTNTYYDVTNLAYGATYYYRVKGSTAITSCFNDAWSATINFVALNSYTPLSVTGFNADVIANGTGIAKISTTNAVDAVNNSYIALDYERISGTVSTIGLPVNRTLSNTTPAVKFLLPDYGGNNALRLPAELQAGTLTLTQQFKVSDLYLAVVSGSGTSTVSAQVNFLDGTSQTASLSVNDWYASTTTNQLITNIGRVNRTDNTGTPETGAAKVFYAPIAITATNQGKIVTSILLTKTSTGATEPVPNIFSVSAKIIDECPTVATTTSTTPTATTATVSWTAGGTAATSYTLEVYTNAAYTTPITGSPFTGITALTYNLSGLTPLTQYYYRIKATNATCVSAYVTGTFTTPCQAAAAPTAATQTVCGPATVANLTVTGVTGATFSWYTVATGGTAMATTDAVTTGTYYVSQTTNACESARTTVAVTVNTVAAPTAAAQTYCTGATVAQLTATGVTGATFTWSATQGGAALASTTTLATGTYYVTQTSAGCTSPATAVSVTITTVNAPTATAQTVCSGTTVSQLVVTGATGATFTWSSTQGGAALAGTTALATGTYYVTQTVGSCTSTATTVSVTVTTTPVPTAAAQTFCAGTPVSQLVVTGGTGATFSWYSTQGGPVLATTTVLATGTYYVTQTLNGCPSSAVPVTITINTTPAPTAAATQSLCAGATVAQLTATGTNLVWSATQGGAALASTATLASGTYYVTQTLNGCLSTATPVAITINTVNAPTATVQSFCVAATVSQLTVSGAAGATFTWSATQGGAALNGTASLATGTYYVTQTVGSCTSTATPVSVTINITPVPTSAAQTFCTGATVSQLAATGTGLKWYASQAGVAVLPGTQVLATGTYFVTQTLNGCESSPAAVSVTINTTPAPTADAQTFCSGATASELLATGTDLNWYATEGGDTLSGTEVLTTGTYYVTQTLNGCVSIATPVSVVVNTTPAPTADAQTFCSGATASELVATGTGLVWYGSQNGNALTGTEALVTGTYYVTQTLNGCQSTATTVDVTVNTTALPTADAQAFCDGALASELVATGTGLVWYATQGGNALTGTEVLVTGTYYVTQTLNGCLSPAAEVAVTVNAIPDAPTGEPTQTFTEGATVADLDVIVVDGATVNWYVKNDADEYIAIDATTELEDGTTYYVSQTNNTCTSDYFAVTVSVTAGTKSFDTANLKVYPNPTRDMLNITNSGTITNVKVVTLLGQTVIDQKVNADTTQVDLSGLSAGNYILQVSGERTSANVKIIKL